MQIDPTAEQLKIEQLEAKVAFLERIIEGKSFQLDQANDWLSSARKNQDRLRFLQSEGMAWPNDQIDRHMKIVADRRGPFTEAF